MKGKFYAVLIFAVMLFITASLAILRGNGVIRCSWMWVFSPIWMPILESFIYVLLKKWFEKE